LEKGLTQQDIANHLGRTAAAISEMERGKVQVSASDLYKIASLLEKPIEYFYGEDIGDKEIENLTAYLRQQPPEARDQSILTLSMITSMQEIANAAEMIEDEEEQRKLAEQFYGVLLPFTKMINDLTSQINKLRDQYAELLEIDNIN
jgi:transcriptional regulator with XRE-family HTH domain